jgi:D-alanine-D-alanine ligase
MKIALLFDGASAVAPTPDLLILSAVDAIEGALAAEGNEVVRIPVHLDARWIERVRRGQFHLAFNMCEGIDGRAELEAAVVSALALLGVPYTGNSPFTTALCLRKPIVNALLASKGLPIPRFAAVRRGDPLPSVGFPAIVKPSAEDASLGVEQRSVVRTSRALRDRVDLMLERWDQVIVQRYVDGREVNAGILGETILPLAEIEFGHLPPGTWPIVTYRSKWDAGSDEDLGTEPRCPARLPAKVAQHVRQVARTAWSLVGGEGYGRVDLRVDPSGQPWILEVNPNPDIAPDAGLARMAGAAGLEYRALIRTVCQLALARPRHVPSTDDQWARTQQLSGLAVSASEAGVFATEDG